MNTVIAIFLVMMILFSLFVLYGVTILRRFRIKELCLMNSRYAQDIASSLWVVDEGSRFHQKDLLAIRFRNFSLSQQTFVLAVRPDHPDFKVFCLLAMDDVVEFAFFDRLIRENLKRELCGHLRIKLVHPRSEVA